MVGYVAVDAEHVEHGDPLGDAYDQLDARVRGLANGAGGEGRRHVDDAGRRTRLGNRLLDRVEHRDPVLEFLASLARCYTRHHVGAVLQHLLGME